MRGITLFIFGGVAEMEDEPTSPKAEFLMAIAGPIASVVIAILLGIVAFAGSSLGMPASVATVFGYLSSINIALAIFNMLPAFPLDGGRVLRSILWWRTKKIRRATRIASLTGNIFGWFLIITGVISVFFDELVGGLWSFLIGMFLRNAANASYQQVVIREILGGEPVSRFMRPDPMTVQRSISVRELVEEYMYRFHYKLFPVMDGDRLVGCVTTSDVKHLPRDEWDRQTVGSILAECSDKNTIAPGTDAMLALRKMSASGSSRLMVVEDGRLVGVLTLKDLLRFLGMKIELE
jgi:CBS domain-containing protein